jgi:hypothetical protein
VCHQTVSLIARHLEANGIPTMCLTSALDIIQAGRPPRATFVDYPLGHTAGKPGDARDQLGILRATLRGFETLAAPGEIQTLPNAWGEDSWRQAASATVGEDSRQPRDETPQFQFETDREAALASGAW